MTTATAAADTVSPRLRSARAAATTAFGAMLMRMAEQNEPFVIYAIIAVAYFAMCYPLSLFSQKLERRMGRGKFHLAPA